MKGLKRVLHEIAGRAARPTAVTCRKTIQRQYWQCQVSSVLENQERGGHPAMCRRDVDSLFRSRSTAMPPISGAFQSGSQPPRTPKSPPGECPDRPPTFTHKFAKFDFEISGRPSMNIEEKCFTPATEIQNWPKTTVHVRENFAHRTLRRRRAAARAKWPMFMPDVAYRIEGLPQPKRRHGRTWAEVARDNFLASFPAA